MAIVTDLSFTFLGSGTSAGVPIIGCDCSVCRSDDPRDRRTRSSACVRFRDPSGQERVFLIDTSPDLRQQALRHDLRRCDGVVFTHSHFDHTYGLDDVRRFNAVMRSAIDVWAESATLTDLRGIFRHIFLPETNINRSFVARLVPREISPARPLDLHGLRWTPLRVWHGDLPIVGFRIDALDGSGRVSSTQPGPLPLAYLTDVSRIPDETRPFLGGLETLVLDMLRPTPHPTHLSYDEAVGEARAIDAAATWFIHMTHDFGHARTDARLPERMALAYDGLELR